MQQSEVVQESYLSLHNYLIHAPSMLSSVDDNQYLRLQNKYKHLILRYINDYNALQKLKQIEREIPQMILNHPNVIAELKGIAQIRSKLDIQNEIYNELVSSIQEKGEEKQRLQSKLKNKKEQLILEKRQYMKLRKSIAEIQSQQNKPAKTNKYTFQNTQKELKTKILLDHKNQNKLDLLIDFKIGMRAMQKREFKTIGMNIGAVLKNIRIKRNISEVENQRDIKMRLTGGKENRLPSTKCTSRKYRMSEKESGPIFHRTRLESEEQDQKVYPGCLMGVSSVELYQRICVSKQDLETFTTMLNDLIYQNYR